MCEIKIRMHTKFILRPCLFLFIDNITYHVDKIQNIFSMALYLLIVSEQCGLKYKLLSVIKCETISPSGSDVQSGFGLYYKKKGFGDERQYNASTD